MNIPKKAILTIAAMDNFMAAFLPYRVFSIRILTQSLHNCQVDFFEKTCYSITKEVVSCQLSELDTA